ncbi:cytochrome c3 family protein [Daejeonella lutea]|uniref:Uncharacterized protein n=1 Tax=Daejeonella lutea TaxID=572036 RepID=A0A1T5AD63_9SPHI|nr:cytochrome c3 family protein [Daejeonella lutea]SKB32835.1 hypothetical protein SAMN05661099_0586 [Daejeonella lutea]
MDNRKRHLLIWLLIGSMVVALSQCTNTGKVEAFTINDFASSETCKSCHKDISEMYAASAHFHTSAPAGEELLKKALLKPEFQFSDSLKVVVERREQGVYQVTYSRSKEIESKKIDVVFGSGEKAMTFGYWSESGLNQLPLTFYTKMNQWVNSPGFPTDHPNYKRAIIGGCLECHSSFAKTKATKTGSLAVSEQVIKGSIAYGIDCQRCHGPSAKHVAFHQENPGVKKANFIISIQSLSRQQKIDNCAVCHSGSDQSNQISTFAFRPGDTLANYYYPYSNSNSEPDVHGNQYQMLAGSACYIKSDMDCSSCHNTHKAEKNNPILYSQRCLNCHKVSEHPLNDGIAASISNNCIDCHMPMQASRLISFQESGKIKKVPYLLRSHKIGVYKDESKKISSYLKSL